MTARRTVTELLEQGVELWVDGQGIGFRGPRGAVTPSLRAALSRHKKEIVALLGQRRRYALPSFAQQRLWFLEQLEPAGGRFNLQPAWRLRGALDVPALAAALTALAQRHETLRTHFVSFDGRAYQVIAAQSAMPLPRIDLTALPVSRRALEARCLAAAEARRPFDLARGPLVRARLFVLQEVDDHVLLLTLHHTIADGWSEDVLRRDLRWCYAHHHGVLAPPLPALVLRYADFARRQRAALVGERQADHLAYWRAQLAAPPTLTLPTDRSPSNVAYHCGAVRNLTIEADEVAALGRIGRDAGASLYMVLLAVFMAFLRRLTGQGDLLVGSPIAGRERQELEEIVGLFVNNLVLRGRCGDDPSFTTFLHRVREAVLGAFAHQALPFEKLVEAVMPTRDLSRNPLFQVFFNLHTFATTDDELPGVPTFTPFASGHYEAGLDLTLYAVVRGDRVDCSLVYRVDLFDATTVERMLQAWARLLRGVIADSGRRLAALPVLGRAARHQVLVAWAGGGRGVDAGGGTVVHRIVAQAARRRDAIAVVQGRHTLTYGALLRRAGGLARRLRRAGVGSEGRVAICIERSPEMVVSVFAVLLAGGTYVPLDPAYPEARLRFLLTDSGAAWLLTSEELLAREASHPYLAGYGGQVIRVDGAVEPATKPPVPRSRPADLAYLAYTSGSTGQPKGVLATHRGVAAYLHALLSVHGFGAADAVLQRAALGFDVAVRDLIAPLTAGARVVLLAPTAVGDPEAVLQVATRQRVTCLPGMVPSLLRQMLAALEAGAPPPRTLRLLMVGGETLPAIDVHRTLRCCGSGVQLVSLYGPTECTGASAFYAVRTAREVEGITPLGRSLPHAWVALFDRHLRPVPIGTVGEVCIGGDGVSRGYHDRPAQTAASFVPHASSRVPGARLYRSGDLARWRSDGVLCFLGRSDHQLKVRGHRIEPGEVEAALCAHPALREAVVVSRTLGGQEGLVAYCVPQQGCTVVMEGLRTHLAACLPVSWIPARFEILDVFPLTPHGKVDRGALPAPTAQRPTLAAAYVQPRTPVEEMLAILWCELLEVEQVGVDDNFFTLGGHSLLAARLAARLRQHFGVALPLRRIFETPTVAALAVAITGALRRGAGVAPWRIMPASRQRPLPLSFAQERLWFLHRLAPSSLAYSLPAAFRVAGPLDLAALVAAAQAVCQRHEVLRTTFALTEGRPVQVITSVRPLPVVLDLTALPRRQREAEGRCLAMAEATQPFDLHRGPLFRLKIICLAASAHIVVLNLHHIVTDGWSRGLLYRELAAGYRAFSRGRAPDLVPLRLQYADFASWQRRTFSGEILAALITHWRTQLAGLPPLALPTDRPRPVTWNEQGAEYAFHLSPRQVAAQQTLGIEAATTPFVTLLAAFLALLRVHTGQEDLAVGTPVAHRPRVELEPLIGFFVNTLVLRVRRVADTFNDLLGRVRETALAAYAHQDLPFEQLVEALAPERDTGRHPLFQVLFVLHNAPAAALDLDGLPWHPLPLSTGAARFDLEVHLWEEEDSLCGTAVYNTVLFDLTTVARLLRHFGTLLESAAIHPDASLGALSRLTTAEQHQMLRAWNDSRTECPARHDLGAIFEEQVARWPDAIATVWGGTVLSYGMLDRLADQLAYRLVQVGAKPEQPVALLLERSLAWAVSIIAVLKCGATAVPLDPADPSVRRERILAEVGATEGAAGTIIVLTSRDLGRQLPAKPMSVLFVEACPEKGDTAAIDSRLSAVNLAYVVYTSGSTGRPKGVAMSYGALANLIAWQIRHARSAQRAARTLHFAALGFDVAWQEMLATWCAGGTLVLVEEEVRRDPEALVGRLARDGVERAFLPVAALNQLALASRSVTAHLPRLGQVITAGEQLLVKRDIARFFSACTETRLENQYGPAETHVVTTHALTGAPRDWPQWVPIGRPIANAEMRLLAADLRPVPLGVVGELCIAGAGLARGYLRQPARTAERFVPDARSAAAGQRLYRSGDLARYRTDGALIFLGRCDRQVKVRGFRVEPGEVEAVLESLPGVRVAAVIPRPDAAGNIQLIAFVTGPKPMSRETLRHDLIDSLPAPYLPAHFVVLDALPRLASGKVDRSALPAAIPQRGIKPASGMAPHTPLEVQLAGLWEEVVGCGQINREDDFFELGGHSLLAIQLMDRIRRTFQVELALRLLFEHPRLDQLAEQIERVRGVLKPALPPIQRLPRAAVVPLSFGQQRLWFLHRLEPVSSAYNQPVALELRGALDVVALLSSLQTLALRHRVLRTRFAVTDGRPRQVVMARLGQLSLVDLEALPAVRRQRAARRLAASEAERPFDLAASPPLRQTLLRLGTCQHHLLITLHHIAADGWSWSVLFRELALLYAALAARLQPALPTLPIQYTDFAAWQRRWLVGEVEARQLAYWQEQLDGLTPLVLPTDRSRPARPSYRGAAQRFVLSCATTVALRACGRAAGATPFMVLAAAFMALLQRLSGQRDIAIGTPVAGRHRGETEPLIGFFVNTLVLRQRLAAADRFITVLRSMREIILDAFAHQDLPFERLVEALAPARDRGRHPLYQVLLALQSAPAATPRLAGLEVQTLDAGRRAVRFDLELHLWEEDGHLHGLVLYSRDLFDSTTMVRLVASFKHLLAAIAADSRQTLGAFPLLDPAQQHQLLVAWRGARYRRPVGLLERFAAQVAAAPDCLAIVHGEEAVSYGVLDRRANGLAWGLRRSGVRVEERVALFAGRSVEAMVAVLAILKAGAAVVPLDPSYPHVRLARMLDDIWGEKPGIVLAERALVGRLPNHRGRLLILGGPAWEEVGPTNGAHDENLAYVVYTSGSSGRPKGVGMTRGALDNLIAWQSTCHIEPLQTLCFASLGFDVIFQELFATWCVGGTLVLAPEEARRDPHVLLALLHRQAVERAFLPVVALEQLAGVGERPARLRWVTTAGEALTITPDVEALFARRPSALLENHYGPSESHVVTTHLLSGSPVIWPHRPPIGRPIAGVAAWVLDTALNPVPIGCVGELGLAGVALARGYLGQPGLSAARFVPCPFGHRAGARLYRSGDRTRHRADGALEFLGRLDDQVKVRGFRVEPAEIEQVLLRHPAVRAAAVIAVGEAASERRLVAFLERPRAAADGSTVCTDDLRADRLRTWLLTRLPEPLVPSRFAILSALPLLAHGKVDRRALAKEAAAGLPLAQAHVAPRTRVETSVVEIWEEVLGVQVGVYDDFFALGGHSLLAVRVMARIAAQLAVDLPLAVLFEDATVAGLAQRIAARPRQPGGPLITLRRNGARRPFFLVHPGGGHLFCYRALVAHLGAAQPCYGLEALGVDGREPFLVTIEMMAARYLEAIRSVQPSGPYQLGGWSMGGAVAYEMARQLGQRGEEVALLVLMDTALPRRRIPVPMQDEAADLASFGRDLGLPEPILREVAANGVEALLTAAQSRGLVTADVDARRLRHLHTLFQHNVQAFRRYAPQPLGKDARLCQMVTTATAQHSSASSPEGWGALVPGGGERCTVPGDHWTMLREPWVRVVASRLDSYLRAVARRAVA